MAVLLTKTSLSIISEARMQIYQRLGFKLEPISPNLKTIHFKKICFRFSKSKDLVISQDINAGLIYFFRNRDSIIFFRKILSNENKPAFENIGSINFDGKGYLLKNGEQYRHRNGARPNYKTQKPYDLYLGDFVEIFGAKERAITISPRTGLAIAQVNNIEIKLSTDPGNVHFQDLASGNIRLLHWPGGRVCFYSKKGNRQEKLGETTVEKLQAHIQKTGQQRVYIPDLIENLGIMETQLTKFFMKKEIPVYHYYSNKIAFFIRVTEDMLYAQDIKNGNLYFREYNDRIEVILKRRGQVVCLGKIQFDNEGRIIEENGLFLLQGKPIKKGERRQLSLRHFVPELTTVQKPFRFLENRRPDTGKRTPECRADAANHIFMLSASKRNPFTQKVIEGKIFLRINPKSVAVYAEEKRIGKLAMDGNGNILGKDGEIIWPAHKKRVPLTTLIPKLQELERDNIAYNRRERNAEIKIMGIKFVLSFRINWIYAKDIKNGEIYWERNKNINKITIYKKGLHSPLGSFVIDNENDEIIREDGKRQPLPPDRTVDLAVLVPALALSANIKQKYEVISHNTIEVPFRYMRYKSKNETKRMCIAEIGGRRFVLPANPRFLYAKLVKQGKVKLRKTPQSLKIYVAGLEPIGEVSTDYEGNIIGARGEILVLANKKWVILSQLIPEVDSEAGRFHIPGPDSGASRAEIYLANMTFYLHLGKKWIYTKDIKNGQIYWKRSGNKIEILKRGQKVPVITFSIDKNKQEIILENGNRVPIPKSREVNLAKIIPSLGLKKGEVQAQPEAKISFLDFLINNDYKNLESFTVNERSEVAIPYILSFRDLTALAANSLLSAKYFYVLNLAMDKLSSTLNTFHSPQKIQLFARLLLHFFIALKFHSNMGRNLNGLTDVLDVHSKDIFQYIERLIEYYGKMRVMLNFKNFEDGALWHYVSPLFEQQKLV